MRTAVAATLVWAASVSADSCAPPASAFLWPLPRDCSFGAASASLPPKCEGLAVSLDAPAGPGHAALASAVSRFQTALYGAPCSAAGAQAGLASLRIVVESTSEWPPARPGSVAEAYRLSVSDTGAEVRANATAGALLALRTFSKLLRPSSGGGATVEGVPVTIVDEPRFSHRGVMIDTARHFLPVAAIKRTALAAAASGMNTLHLHLTDAQSFPVEVPGLPELAAKGAYGPRAVFSAKDLEDVAAYASDLGMVVIPEVDVPGHAYSFGLGYPNVTADCPAYAHNINNIPLNPAVQFSAEVVQSVLRAVTQAFGGELVHIGVSRRGTPAAWRCQATTCGRGGVAGSVWGASPAICRSPCRAGKRKRTLLAAAPPPPGRNASVIVRHNDPAGR